MSEVTGYVSYDVKVECPSCGKHLYLNQYPYIENEESDELGLMLFGTKTEPAKWKGNIIYKCIGCKNDFTLCSLVLAKLYLTNSHKYDYI